MSYCHQSSETESLTGIRFRRIVVQTGHADVLRRSSQYDGQYTQAGGEWEGEWESG